MTPANNVQIYKIYKLCYKKKIALKEWIIKKINSKLKNAATKANKIQKIR